MGKQVDKEVQEWRKLWSQPDAPATTLGKTPPKWVNGRPACANCGGVASQCGCGSVFAVACNHSSIQLVAAGYCPDCGYQLEKCACDSEEVLAPGLNRR